jgi:hypothetical protein
MGLMSTILLTWWPVILIFLVWLIPMVLIYRSQKVVQQEKLAWLVATIFISWFSWVLFILLAPIKKE